MLNSNQKKKSNNELLVIGRVGKPWGVQGFNKIISYTQPITNIFSYQPWYISKKPLFTFFSADATEAKIEIKNAESMSVKFANVNDRNASQAICNSWIQIPNNKLPELKNQYYWHELIGLEVYNEQICFGVVNSLLPTGSKDILIIEPTPESVDNKQRLIPFVIGVYVLNVDTSNKRLEVHWELDYD